MTIFWRYWKRVGKRINKRQGLNKFDFKTQLGPFRAQFNFVKTGLDLLGCGYLRLFCNGERRFIDRRTSKAGRNIIVDVDDDGEFFR